MPYDEEYYDDMFYDELSTLLDKNQEKHDEEVAGAMVCAYFMATTIVLGALGTPALANLAVNQRGRYEIHGAIEGKEGPWSYSPEGWGKSQLASGVVNTMRGEGFSPSNISGMYGKTMPNDLGYLNNGRGLLESSGQFGYHEGLLQGQLEVYEGHELGIPWTTCEDNGNCGSESPVCPDCESLSGEIFPADGFEEYLHNWCRCNEPLADPVPAFVMYKMYKERNKVAI